MLKRLSASEVGRCFLQENSQNIFDSSVNNKTVNCVTAHFLAFDK